MSGQVEESDVARALAAFNSPQLKYRVFSRPPIPAIPLHTPEPVVVLELPGDQLLAAGFETSATVSPPVPASPAFTPVPPPPLIVPSLASAAAEAPLEEPPVTVASSYQSFPPLAPEASLDSDPPRQVAARPSIMDVPGRPIDPQVVAERINPGTMPVWGMFHTAPIASAALPLDPSHAPQPAPLTAASSSAPLEALFRDLSTAPKPHNGPPPPSEALRDIFRRLS